MLITFEGLDFMGKSSLVRSVGSVLFGKTFITRSPGSPHNSLNPQLRQLALNEPMDSLTRRLLFSADAQEHQEVLRTKSKEGLIVLADRGKWSQLAYLYGDMKERDLSYEAYLICKSLSNYIYEEPHFYVYLRGSLELMKERMQGAKKDLIEQKPDSFFNFVLDKYNDLSLNSSNVLILEATDTVEHNTKEVVEYINHVDINR